MRDFKPEIGLVICYAYLWWNEARAGREEGVKDRPPEKPEQAMEMPVATKKRLGLDREKSWIITTEVNRITWTGPDIRSVPGGKMAYGFLPAAMAADLVKQIKKNADNRALLVAGRDDAVLNERVRKRVKPKKGHNKDG